MASRLFRGHFEAEDRRLVMIRYTATDTELRLRYLRLVAQYLRRTWKTCLSVMEVSRTIYSECKLRHFKSAARLEAVFFQAKMYELFYAKYWYG